MSKQWWKNHFHRFMKSPEGFNSKKKLPAPGYNREIPLDIQAARLLGDTAYLREKGKAGNEVKKRKKAALDAENEKWTTLDKDLTDAMHAESMQQKLAEANEHTNKVD